MCETEAVPWMTQGTAQQHLEMIVNITGMTRNTVETHSQLNLAVWLYVIKEAFVTYPFFVWLFVCELEVKNLPSVSVWLVLL